jgi:hypothetical protein
MACPGAEVAPVALLEVLLRFDDRRSTFGEIPKVDAVLRIGHERTSVFVHLVVAVVLCVLVDVVPCHFGPPSNGAVSHFGGICGIWMKV